MSLSVLPDQIPAALKSEKRWLAWREVREGNRLAKKPLSRVNDPRTWLTFTEALKLYHERNLAGIGFVLGDGWAGIDLDYCRENNKLIDDATPVVMALGEAYIEVSPSEKGLKAFGRTHTTTTGFEVRFQDGMRVSPYAGARYFAVTGHGSGDPTTDLTELIEDWVEEMEADPKPDFLPKSSIEGWEDMEEVLDVSKIPDNELLIRARTSRNGDKFQRLWDGDLTGYASASEADLALCCLLMFWTQRDVNRVEDLFGRSRLVRKKWWQRTYRRATLRAALTKTDRVYEPLLEADPIQAKEYQAAGDGSMFIEVEGGVEMPYIVTEEE